MANLDVNKSVKSWLALGSLLVVMSPLAACSKAKDKLSEMAAITLTGSVKKAGSETPIEGATVRAIKLLDQNAISQLVEVVKIPDGKGGEKDKLRIKMDKVHAYAADMETLTDAAGNFSMKAPIQAYLVYTFGPGSAPGTAGSYTVDFWGINPETGELSLDHLIGRNGKTTQTKSDIYLAGGPTPPPVPQPPAPPAPPEVSKEEPPMGPVAEPTAVNVNKPEDIVPPQMASDFWKTDISITHANGDLDAKNPSLEEIKLPGGQRYFELRAELNAAQSEPVKLVMQVGFDTADLPDCPDVRAAAKTVVYDLMPNGTKIDYKLVAPGPFYKLYLAKSATKEDGKPVVAEKASSTLTVGKRDCSRARPERPFLATLSWDKDMVDLDLHVASALWKDVNTNGDSAQMIDLANWTHREGNTLSLDVDNVVGFGPESNGEAATITDVNSNCYAVQVQAYSGANFPTKGRVDIVQVTQKDGIYKVDKHTLEHEFTRSGEWWQVGIFPPNCKTEAPPAPPVEAVTATAAGTCTYPAEFNGLDIGKNSLFKATGKFDGKDVVMTCEYGNTNRVVPGKNAQTYDDLPSEPSGDTPVSVMANCSTELDGRTLRANLWLMRVKSDSKMLEAKTTTTAYPYVQLSMMYTDNSKILRTPNAYGSSKDATFVGGGGNLDILEKIPTKLNRAKRAKGCFGVRWDEKGGGKGNLSGFFDLNFIN